MQRRYKLQSTDVYVQTSKPTTAKPTFFKGDRDDNTTNESSSLANDESMDCTNVDSSTVKTVITKSKRKNKRSMKRKGNKNVNGNNSKVVEMFSIVGTNANGLMTKKDSLVDLVENLSPTAVLIQGSKLKKVGQVKIAGYQVFERLGKQ